jgi:hypothetical protein
MSKRLKAKVAQDAYWFNKDQEVSKAVMQMTDPEYKVEFDGKETYVMCNGVKLAIRRDDRWVSIEPGVTVRDNPIPPATNPCCNCLVVSRSRRVPSLGEGHETARIYQSNCGISRRLAARGAGAAGPEDTHNRLTQSCYPA